MIENAPIGQGLEVVLRESPKGRSIDQQALLFAGPLKDISEQVWSENRQYTVEIWHTYFKQEFLPDDVGEPYLHELVKNPESYKKWDYLPNGERKCIGSTTDLTKYGYSLYLDKVHAFGGNRGVLFHTVKQS
jgi:hypothetical protein